MAVDLQVVFPQESVKLNNVRVTSLQGIGAVYVTGTDFTSVDEVVVNDSPAKEVVVISKTELLAQLPDYMQGAADVRSVMVLSRQLTMSPRSLIRFRIGKTPGKVRGILRLVQLFLKILFTTPGSDIFNPGMGGGALRFIGDTFGKDEGHNILTDFVIAVTTTQRQIIGMQSRDQRSPRDERMLAANVTGANFDKSEGALYVQVDLLSQAGTRASVNVEL